MLTDDELIMAAVCAPANGTTRATLLGLGRAVEAAVLDKQARLLRECELAGAAHFIGDVAAIGINDGNSRKEYVGDGKATTFHFKRDEDKAAEIQPCVHCGWQPLGDLACVVYPTGKHAIWLAAGTPAQAMHLQKVPGHPSMAEWEAWCLPSRGGCGAKVWGLSREGAIAAWDRRDGERTPGTELPDFAAVWKQKYEWDGKRGYRYGSNALEQVRFGYEIARGVLIENSRTDGVDVPGGGQK